MQKIYQKNNGFTLIELVVTTAIFSLVVVGAIGITVNVFGAQQKAIALKEVLDNSRFPIEILTRELRTATNIRVPIQPAGCPFAGLQFTSHNNEVSPQERFYYWQPANGTIMRVAMPVAGIVDCTKAQEMTASEVFVDNMFISPFGLTAGPSDGQPRITFGFRVQSRNTRLSAATMINVQTTVTQRLRDVF